MVKYVKNISTEFKFNLNVPCIEIELSFISSDSNWSSE